MCYLFCICGTVCSDVSERKLVIGYLNVKKLSDYQFAFTNVRTNSATNAEQITHAQKLLLPYSTVQNPGKCVRNQNLVCDGRLENADTDAGQWTPDIGQTMERTDSDGKDGQTMKKTDSDGKDGQTMEKTDKRWKRRTRFLIDCPFTNI